MERAGEELVDEMVGTPRVSGGHRGVTLEPVERHQVETTIENQSEAEILMAQNVGAVDGEKALGVDRRAEQMEVGTTVGLKRSALSRGIAGEGRRQGQSTYQTQA